MRTITAIVFSLIFCSHSMADERAQPEQKPSQGAGQAITPLSHLNTEVNSRGTFVQKRWLTILEQPLISEGNFEVTEDGAIRWTITAPFAISYFYNEDVLEVTELDESRIVAKQQDPILFGFFAFFSRIFQYSGEEVNEWFDLSIDARSTGEEKTVHLTPKKSFMKRAFSRAEIVESEGVVERVTIFESEDDKLELLFSYPHE